MSRHHILIGAVVLASALSILFALMQWFVVSAIEIPLAHSQEEIRSGELTKLCAHAKNSVSCSISVAELPRERDSIRFLLEVQCHIWDAAHKFVTTQYEIFLPWTICYALVIFLFSSWSHGSVDQPILTNLAFLFGTVVCISAGYVSMKIALFTSARAVVAAQHDKFGCCFDAAFRASNGAGIGVSGFALLSLFSFFLFTCRKPDNINVIYTMSGFALGVSNVAMFGRIGGSIFKNSADISANLIGNVVHNIAPDDPRNPAVIAELVGDNVGSIAGMGSDMLSSWIESICAVLILSVEIGELSSSWTALCFPFLVMASSLIICLLISFLATSVDPVRRIGDIDLTLRIQLVIATILIIPAAMGWAYWCLPDNMLVIGMSKMRTISASNAAICVVIGALGGLFNCLITEYHTSQDHEPVQLLARSACSGAATEILSGIGLGLGSTVPSCMVLATLVYISFRLCDIYGIGLVATGMTSILPVYLTVATFGPICDNAAGMAQLLQLNEKIQSRLKALDSAGNILSAIGRGYAIQSAALSSLALYGAFVSRLRYLHVHSPEFTGKSPFDYDLHIGILEPLSLSFLIFGSCLPYWLSSVTIKSVSKTALDMMEELEQQFVNCPELLVAYTLTQPDYSKCVLIAAKASHREMFAPAAMMTLIPLVTGTLFGVHALFGLLAGMVLSGVHLAMFQSNTGSAWNAAKRGMERICCRKTSPVLKATVIGDIIGDPFKDTTAPAINILLKIVPLTCLVFAPFFMAINGGKGLLLLPVN